MSKSQLFRIYKEKIYPKVNHIRGTTRLYQFLGKFAYHGIPEYSGSPESIYEYSDEWENCFIIDACRLDLYQEVYPGEAEKRVSLGSSSPDYVRETYSEGDYSDVVYVTGNPHFSEKKFQELTGRSPEDVFHTVFHTYDTDWVEGKGRPSTEAIMRDTRTARKLYPDKKVVVHFMKPHHPFDAFDFDGFDKRLDGTYENSVWAYGERGELSWSKIWEAYQANLREIMNALRPLAEEIEGKTVVTSDHGNLCGENGMGHHPGMRSEKPLREVPWVKLYD